MNLDWTAVWNFWHGALAGMASPWVIALVLALTTLLLEDVAIAAGVVVAAQGAIAWEWAFVAVAGGIALGDLGLYGIGWSAHRVPRLRRRYIEGRDLRAGQLLRRQLPGAVLLARVVPGLRLLTYTACGYLRVPLGPFTVWVVMAVVVWTAGLFWFASALGTVIAERFGVPVALAVALPVLVLAAIVPALRWFHKTCFKSAT